MDQPRPGGGGGGGYYGGGGGGNGVSGGGGSSYIMGDDEKLDLGINILYRSFETNIKYEEDPTLWKDAPSNASNNYYNYSKAQILSHGSNGHARVTIYKNNTYDNPTIRNYNPIPKVYTTVTNYWDATYGEYQELSFEPEPEPEPEPE